VRPETNNTTTLCTVGQHTGDHTGEHTGIINDTTSATSSSTVGYDTTVRIALEQNSIFSVCCLFVKQWKIGHDTSVATLIHTIVIYMNGGWRRHDVNGLSLQLSKLPLRDV